jgi:hypothetical protein
MATTVVQVDTIQVIYKDNTRTPLIGPDSPDGEHVFAPWKWDERMWTDEYFENSERAIPVLGDQDTRGIPEEYWQSGVGDDQIDLEVLEPAGLRQESQERWTAHIRHGDYYKFHKPRYLFADRSQVQFVDNTENESSRNVLQLDEVPKYGSSIMALMWTRNELGEPVLFRFIQKRMQFTGLYDEDGEQDTIDSAGDIVWSAVDTSRREFVVQWTGNQTTPPKLYFNQDHTFLLGRASVSDVDDLEYCDFLGEGQGPEEDQVLFTEHFPILDNNELKLYKLVGAVITEMVRWTSDYESGVDPVPEYVIDIDRGEITFPETINDVATDIVPPSVGVKIYAVYRPTIEVEYEPETCNNFLTAPYVNMSPVRTAIDRGFIYLTERELRVAYLELSTDAPLIEDDSYGPLYLGSDYCFLVATAYNSRGQPVPGVTVSFYLDSVDDGRLNGSIALAGSEITAMTDGEGKARVVYTSPRSIESVGQYLAHESGSEPQYQLELVHNNGVTSEQLDSLFVYQVFNDDGMQEWHDDSGAGTGEEPGYGGRKVILYRKTIAAELGGGTAASSDRFAGDSDDLHPRTGEDGDTTDVWMPLRPAEITGNTLTFKDSVGSNVDLPWTVDPPGDWTIAFSYVTNDIVWHSSTWKWYKCLSNHTALPINEPGTGSTWETYWVEDLNAGNLVSYWVSGGKQVPAHAKCFSYLYNNYIDSNDIELRVDVPEYLTGVYVNEDNKEIPYGFRLYDENSAASGLDGATFLSINPKAGKWPIIWDGSELAGREEDAYPFHVLGHEFVVYFPGVLGHEFTVTIS